MRTYKIYTSYFGKLKKLGEYGVIPVSIARYDPRWYTGLNIRALAPLPYMLKMDDCDYNIAYTGEVLNKLNIERLSENIENKFGGQTIALCCYEKEPERCHRSMLAEFLNKRPDLFDIQEFDETVLNLTSTKVPPSFGGSPGVQVPEGGPPLQMKFDFKE